jgi:hypothetical protein
MSYPSSGLEGTYRNKIQVVSKENLDGFSS